MEISANKTKFDNKQRYWHPKTDQCERIVHLFFISFEYLGAVVSNASSKPEILSRIAQTTAALTKLKPVWRDNNISLGSKVKLIRSLVMSIFLYACESWTLIAQLEKRIQAFEMKCYRTFRIRTILRTRRFAERSKPPLESMMNS